ncbi:hypothetical protein DF186_19715, partial [Enterococcus hirae]
RVKDFDHVIGFDSLNEPHSGFIGIDDLGKFPEFIIPGVMYTPFDAIAAGSGFARPARRFKQQMVWVREVGQEIINPDEISAWLD